MLELNGIPVARVEYRPGDGLVLRLANDGPQDAAEGLRDLVGGGPARLYRACCDSAPVAGEKHADGCKEAKAK